MPTVPDFGADGLLPPGDYEVSFDELRRSVLAVGPQREEYASWDTSWRLHLIDNLEVMVRQLWQVGIQDVYVDGSFAEDKYHPNDIDGYFVCPLDLLRARAN